MGSSASSSGLKHSKKKRQRQAERTCYPQNANAASQFPSTSNSSEDSVGAVCEDRHAGAWGKTSPRLSSKFSTSKCPQPLLYLLLIIFKLYGEDALIIRFILDLKSSIFVWTKYWRIPTAITGRVARSRYPWCDNFLVTCDRRAW